MRALDQRDRDVVALRSCDALTCRIPIAVAWVAASACA
jgi:hypothetical protein